MPKDLKKKLNDPRKWEELAEELGKDRTLRAFLGTTQAIDLIQGGVKSNALPEVRSSPIHVKTELR
jgi:Gly-Xaa carboxypeptidase